MRYQIVYGPGYNHKLGGPERIQFTVQIFTGLSAVKLRDRVMIRDFAAPIASFAASPSTALSHEQEAGVKWNAKRGWRASQARTHGF